MEKLFNNDEYKELLQVIAAFKDNIEDLQIRNGQISCVLNDNNSLVFADVNKIFDGDVEFQKLKEKIDIMKIFSKSNEITFKHEENNKFLSISDNITKLQIIRPIVNLLNNTFVEPKNHDEVIEQSTHIVSAELDEDKISRLSSVAKIMGKTNAQLCFTSSDCTIKVKGTERIYNDSIIFTLPTISDIGEVFGGLPLELFDISFDFKAENILNLDVWKLPNDSNILYIRIKGKLSENVDGIFYARSKIE